MNNGLVSEDIYAFLKLQQAGIKLWLDPTMTCNHTGAYKFQGDFARWYSSTTPAPIRRQL
jgi:starvation-inducible outer membrane lipoprotein